MLKKKIIILVCFIGTAIISCKKESNNVNPKIDVSGITETDHIGNIISSIDNTDWTLDNPWISSQESALFQPPNTLQLSGMEKATINLYPAFPNPTPGSIILLKADISKPTLVQFVITDNMLSVKDRHFASVTSTSSLSSSFAIDVSKYLNNTNYRIYYAFYSLADGLYYYGHGDIKILH